jgi:hypothetical protein
VAAPYKCRWHSGTEEIKDSSIPLNQLQHSNKCCAVCQIPQITVLVVLCNGTDSAVSLCQMCRSIAIYGIDPRLGSRVALRSCTKPNSLRHWLIRRISVCPGGRPSHTPDSLIANRVSKPASRPRAFNLPRHCSSTAERKMFSLRKLSFRLSLTCCSACDRQGLKPCLN